MPPNNTLQSTSKPTDCQKLSIGKPKIEGISQFHNNMTKPPSRAAITTRKSGMNTRCFCNIVILSIVLSFIRKAFYLFRQLKAYNILKRCKKATKKMIFSQLFRELEY